MSIESFAEELRKWWSFDDRQRHTHSWHSREDFIEKKLPELLAAEQADAFKPIDGLTVINPNANGAANMGVPWKKFTIGPKSK